MGGIVFDVQHDEFLGGEAAQVRQVFQEQLLMVHGNEFEGVPLRFLFYKRKEVGLACAGPFGVIKVENFVYVKDFGMSLQKCAQGMCPAPLPRQQDDEVRIIHVEAILVIFLNWSK